MVKELMRLTQAVPGDTAECGAYEGAGSYLICEANASNITFKRHHHIFDSFEGVSAPTAIDGHYWAAGAMARSEDVVRKNLGKFDAYTLHKGWIPERFPDVAGTRFSFVHVDVDLFEPTRDSFQFFYDKMSDGGIIVCDDYGFSTCPGATRAIDAFLISRPERMIAMPGGGGFMIKGVATAEKGAPASP